MEIELYMKKILHVLFIKISNRSLFLLSIIIRLVAPTRRGRVLMWSYGGKSYSCNPRALTDFMIQNYPEEYEIFWAFLPGKEYKKLPKDVKSVVFKTIKYIWIINTAEFIVTNTRNFLSNTLWIKKKSQKYIMTWHSSMGIKCIEGDASIESLGEDYVKAAKFDSKQCNLILSGSRFRTEVIKRAFWYKGEILEQGTPRNDILFNDLKKIQVRKSVRTFFKVPQYAPLVLYAPTFRKSGNLSVYQLNWDKLNSAFKNVFGSEDCYSLVRLHPNLIEPGLETSRLIAFDHVMDATQYPDMQELLIAADVLITDYSSSMFDFSYIRKPVFLYAPDFKEYDRDTYFELDKLPFILAKDEKTLLEAIEQFNMASYLHRLTIFLDEKIGSFEKGESCSSVIKWMKNNN